MNTLFIKPVLILNKWGIGKNNNLMGYQIEYAR